MALIWAIQEGTATHLLMRQATKEKKMNTNKLTEEDMKIIERNQWWLMQQNFKGEEKNEKTVTQH